LEVVSSIPTVPICDTLEEALQLFRNASREHPPTPSLFAWTTDPHLNAADESTIHKFCIAARSSGAAGLLLTGDIGEANSVVLWLEYLAEHIGIPIYFVLGNHDYYGSSVAAVRQQMRELDHPLLHWMPEEGCVQLDAETALVGHDGWGDARVGDFDRAPIMTDFLAVEDLARQIDREDLLDGFQQRGPLKRKLQELGDDAAKTLAPALRLAVAEYRRVIVLTHYPPFREASVHDGRITSDDWLAVTTCKAMGDLLLEVAKANGDVSIDVLCGHTHREAATEILPNLRVHTGRGGYERLYLGWVRAEKDDIRVELPRLLEGHA
jgi:predicted phosphohydrolase